MYSTADFPALSSMAPISLREISAVSLMNRTDTKFVTTADILVKILEESGSHGYRVLEIAGERLMSYQSIYYDTDDLCMFTDHRNRKLVRKKVRVRKYMVSGETFLEVKRKNNHRRTKKKRLLIPSENFFNFFDAPGAKEFLFQKTNYTSEQLSPETTTDFDRITLVDPGMSERVTIDTNVNFNNFRSGKKEGLSNLVIIELKQDGLKRSSFREILKRYRVFPFRISKYCMAVTLTDPAARYGRFKEKIRYIEKLTDRKIL